MGPKLPAVEDWVLGLGAKIFIIAGPIKERQICRHGVLPLVPKTIFHL